MFGFIDASIILAVWTVAMVIVILQQLEDNRR